MTGRIDELPGRAPGLALQTPQETTDLGRLADLWQAAEDLDFRAAFTFDHLVPLHPGERPGSRHSGPRRGAQLDGWLTAAVLAGRTRRLQVGTLVSGVTYRPLGTLAKLAVTLDHATGGRAVLGLGAGWHREEHRMYGLPFPPSAQRLELLAETAAAVGMLCTRPVTTYGGRHVRLRDAVFEPKPVRPGGVPLLVGGSSERVIAIAGRHAAIYNGFAPPPDWPRVHRGLDAAAVAAGRRPSDVARSAFVRAELTGDAGREQALVAEVAATRGLDVGAARERVLTGDVEEIARGLRRYAEAGVGMVVVSPGPDVTIRGLTRLAAARTALAGGFTPVPAA